MQRRDWGRRFADVDKDPSIARAKCDAKATVINSKKHESVLRAIADRPVLFFGMVWLFYVGAVNALNVSTPQILALKTGLDTQGFGRLVAVGGVLGVGALMLNQIRRESTHGTPA